MSIYRAPATCRAHALPGSFMGHAKITSQAFQRMLPAPRPALPLNLGRSKWREKLRRNLSTKNVDVRLDWVTVLEETQTKVYGGWDSQQPRFVPAQVTAGLIGRANHFSFSFLGDFPRLSLLPSAKVLSLGAQRNPGVQVGTQQTNDTQKPARMSLAAQGPDQRPPHSAPGYDSRLWLQVSSGFR